MRSRWQVSRLSREWEHTQAWVATVDEEGWVETCNRPLTDTNKVDLVALCNEDDRPKVAAALRDAIHPGLPRTIDLDLALPDGRRVLTANISPHGKSALVVAIDITDRRKEEERLQLSERLMRDTEGMSHFGTWYWDTSKPNAEWSREMFRIYGLDPDAHTPTYQDYLNRVHKDDVEVVKAETERVFNEQIPYSHDERILHTDGTWRDLHTWASPIVEDGELVGLVGVCQDITAQKEAERQLVIERARYKAVFDHSGAALVLNRDGIVLLANDQFKNVCQVEEKDLLDKPVQSFFSGSDIPAAVATAVDAPVDILAKCPQGERWLLHMAPLGKDVLVAATHAPEGDLETLRAENKWKTQLLQMASHELKNPLTPIMLNLHLLQATLKDDEKEKASRIARQVRRLSTIVHDYLDMARIEQGKLDLNFEEIDVFMMAKQIAADEATTEVGIKVEGDNFIVHADASRIRQVLTNLVQNAIRFSPPRSQVSIKVTGRKVTVSDHGPGVPADRAGELFQPFGTISGKDSKNGLGLYICRTIIESHGGEIGVESGEGGKFWFSLPKGKRSDEEE